MTIKVGDKHQVEVHVSGDSTRVNVQCNGKSRDEDAIAQLINTAWMLDPNRLIAGARDRVGFDVQSEAGVTYAHESDTLADDQVMLYYLDTELTVPEADYARLVGTVVRMATEDELAAALPRGPELRALADEVLLRTGRSK